MSGMLHINTDMKRLKNLYSTKIRYLRSRNPTAKLYHSRHKP